MHWARWIRTHKKKYNLSWWDDSTFLYYDNLFSVAPLHIYISTVVPIGEYAILFKISQLLHKWLFNYWAIFWKQGNAAPDAWLHVTPLIMSPSGASNEKWNFFFSSIPCCRKYTVEHIQWMCPDQSYYINVQKLNLVHPRMSANAKPSTFDNWLNLTIPVSLSAIV